MLSLAITSTPLDSMADCISQRWPHWYLYPNPHVLFTMCLVLFHQEMRSFLPWNPGVTALINGVMRLGHRKEIASNSLLDRTFALGTHLPWLEEAQATWRSHVWVFRPLAPARPLANRAETEKPRELTLTWSNTICQLISYVLFLLLPILRKET